MSTLFPAINAHSTGPDGTVQLTLRLTPELTGFDGHFPGCPILPGVMQIHWLMHFAQQHFALTGAFARLEQLKFIDLALPGQTLTLSMNWDAASGSLSFEYRSEAGKVSSGRVRLA
jgi:3-hydroxymyristoyl/3-hydroxydecanoyl-(acyl carrier protein) dehydratase